MDTSELSTSTVLDALADQRRRYVLASLKEREKPVPLADMAYEVAGRVEEREDSEISATEAKQVYTALWHCHIPKLVDAGIVEYDQDRGTVTLTEAAQRLGPSVEQGTAERSVS